MIRFKLGYPDVALRTLHLYTSAVLEATLFPPPVPKQQWRDAMDEMSASSLAAYRTQVRENPQFVKFFRQVTSEVELGSLALGSRPTWRKTAGGIESLRAIPWIFAWTQTRLILPTWLGSGTALRAEIDEDDLEKLREMIADWPFLNAYVGLLAMALSKTAPDIFELYLKRLVPAEEQALGVEFLRRLDLVESSVNEILDQDRVLDSEPGIQETMDFRNLFIDPLHYLQVELLARFRSDPQLDAREDLSSALKVTIAGIAAGMRNTG